MENYNDLQQERLKFNPFLSVWLHPKQTARYMINDKSIGFAILILSIGYIGSMMTTLQDSGNSESLSDFSPWVLVLLCVIFAPVTGIIGTAFSALILWLFGKLFKGTGTFSELFKGLSITIIPSIVLIPLYVIWLLTSPETLMDLSNIGGISWIFLILSLLVAPVVGIWSFVITVGVVAEAHQISNWMAFFTILLPFIIFIILIVILTITLAGIFIVMN
ncbi:Yip1 family protein [Lysinibacillus sp. CNPSo 3705]|uniref:Yip1 family protein n=1 Tax=Lysinibacillus sp. CNPSo 3705 TaxID=3028148 RepID=UPI00236476EE|nr:Yip1 family protein [Lysinibacillus sp. CNPSo 3705]MDD1505941.1 Yip1 family protein [Lysinibacillus sp. CNPSo 3705]